MDMTQKQVDMLRAAKAEKVHSTKQIISDEFKARQKIKRAAVTRIRRRFYGPTLKPALRDQALQFCSFGTLVQLEALERVRNRD